MPVFKISSNVAGVIAGTGGLIASSSSKSSLRNGGSLTRVMKGTIPTQSEINTIDWSTGQFRQTDMLFEFTTSSTFLVGTAGTDQLKWNFLQVLAANSGIASWFMMHGKPQTSTSLNTAVVVGSITLPGNGGDMTLTDLNVVSGNLYDVGPATFTIPRNYTYV